MQQCKHEVYRDKKSYNYNVLAKSVTTKLSCQKKKTKKKKKKNMEEAFCPFTS